MFTVERQSRGSKRKSDTSGARTAPTGWIEKPSAGSHSDGSDKKRTKLNGQDGRQLRLVCPGELGTGIATLRGSSIPSGAKQAPAASSSRFASQTKSKRQDGTLNAFMVPKSGSQKPKQREKERQSGATTKKVPNATTSQRQQQITKNVKGKGRVVRQEESSDSETQSEGEQDEEEINLRSDKSEYMNIGNDIFKLPPMPIPLPAFDFTKGAEEAIEPAQTVFGFGALPKPPTPKAAFVQPRIPSAKRRRVVQTSSPVIPSTPAGDRDRVLVSPSSDLSPLQQQHEQDESEESEVEQKDDEAAGQYASKRVHRAEAEGAIHPVPTASVSKPPRPSQRRATGQPAASKGKSASTRLGSRVPWDSDDESERVRLNLRPTSSQKKREVLHLKKRKQPPSPARRPPSVVAETTNYMDRFREESYSPVQYTMSESMKNELLRRLGRSPKRREKQPERWRAPGVAERRAEVTNNIGGDQVAADDSETERTPQEEVPAQPPSEAEEDEIPFDESATERTLPSQQPPKLHSPPSTPAKLHAAADDSGCFVVPSSSSQAASPSQYILAPETDPSEQEHPLAEELDPKDVVEASILPPTVKRFRAQLEGLETEMETETQFISHPETVHILVEETVPSSQGQADLVEAEDEEGEMEMLETLLPITGTSKAFKARVLQSQLLGYPETMNMQQEEERVEDSQDEGDEEDFGMDLDNSQPSQRGAEEEVEIADSQDEGEDEDEGESSQEIEFELLQRKPRILVPDTQEVLDVETQEIEAGETQFIGNSGEMVEEQGEEKEEMVPCSQEEELEMYGLEVEELPEAEGAEAILALETKEAKTQPISMLERSALPKKPTNIESSIAPAWFSNVLQPNTASSSGTHNKGEQQTSLTSFFALKPGGAAERAAEERERRESEFLSRVGREMQLSRGKERKVSFETSESGEQAEEGIEDADDEEEEAMTGETQFVPSSQTQLDIVSGGDLEDYLEDILPDLPETQQVADSDGEAEGDEEEDMLDGDVSIRSCEGWVEGTSLEVPSPVKRARMRNVPLSM